MELKEFLTQIKQKSNKFTPNPLDGFRIAIFDSDNFSYEILGIEIDEETKRVIVRVKDSILVPITRERKDMISV